MNKIKFSHTYTKMPFDREQTKLLEVFITYKKDLSPEFLWYDTQIEGISGNYKLPDGKLLVLLLLSLQDDSLAWQPWTTVRRWTPEKEKYYRSIRGEMVEIVIEGD
jgi:hypothetical protein